MTPSELRYQIESNKAESHFFDRKTMRFFGDTMANFGCRAVTVVCDYDAAGNYCKEGATIEAWELYRKRPVKCNNSGSFYFNKTSFARVYPRKG